MLYFQLKSDRQFLLAQKYGGVILSSPYLDNSNSSWYLNRRLPSFLQFCLQSTLFFPSPRSGSFIRQFFHTEETLLFVVMPFMDVFLCIPRLVIPIYSLLFRTQEMIAHFAVFDS